MIITIAREQESLETRVILTPAGVQRLVEKGHEVYVERSAGEGAQFPDEDYIMATFTIRFGGQTPGGKP